MKRPIFRISFPPSLTRGLTQLDFRAEGLRRRLNCSEVEAGCVIP